jgi:hypothetical protein
MVGWAAAIINQMSLSQLPGGALHGWWRLGRHVKRGPTVEIRVGYELIYDCPQPTPMMLVLNIHYTRASDILVPDHVTTDRLYP